MTQYRLVIASESEAQTYAQAQASSGLPNELRYLEKDPLALQERGNPQRRGYDHVHLSVPDTAKSLMQWWGRGATGYHYPIGAVMRMVSEEE